MGDVSITIQTILAFFGGIAVIAGGASAILKLFNPLKALKSKVDDHEQKLVKDFERMNTIDKTLCDVEEYDKVICKSLLVLLNHEITGNGVDKLKEQRDVLEQFLINKWWDGRL